MKDIHIIHTFLLIKESFEFVFIHLFDLILILAFVLMLIHYLSYQLLFWEL